MLQMSTLLYNKTILTLVKATLTRFPFYPISKAFFSLLRQRINLGEYNLCNTKKITFLGSTQFSPFLLFLTMKCAVETNRPKGTKEIFQQWKRDEKPHGCRVFITAPHQVMCVCGCVQMWKVSGGWKKGEKTMVKKKNKKIFSFIHAMIISLSPFEARLNWSMMKICTSRERCWIRKSSVSIKRLKSVLRIHDQFELWAGWRGEDAGGLTDEKSKQGITKFFDFLFGSVGHLKA